VYDVTQKHFTPKTDGVCFSPSAALGTTGSNAPVKEVNLLNHDVWQTNIF